jgi:uncharacterized RDD family membrane protein YckC
VSAGQREARRVVNAEGEEVSAHDLSAVSTPPVWRRLACFVYEGMLLFGVVMVAGLVYGAVTQQRHALIGQSGLQLTLFVVLGAYFVGFWANQGQTLAMRTWHIQLQTANGDKLSVPRATARYLFSWLWFLPSLAIIHASGLKGGGPFLGVLTAGVLAYTVIARLQPKRQYLHDVLCGTRLVDTRPHSRTRKSQKPPTHKT